MQLPSLPSPVRAFVESEIRALLQSASSIAKGTYLTVEQVDRLTDFLFREGRGEYVGIESNLPSTFYKFYPAYLSKHEQYTYTSTRVLLVSSPFDLHNDYMRDSDSVQRFLEWHERMDVSLRYFYRGEAEELARALNLPSTDVGVWTDTYAVFFRPENNKIWVRFVRKDNPLFERTLAYVRRVLKRSEECARSGASCYPGSFWVYGWTTWETARAFTGS